MCRGQRDAILRRRFHARLPVRMVHMHTIPAMALLIVLLLTRHGKISVSFGDLRASCAHQQEYECGCLCDVAQQT